MRINKDQIVEDLDNFIPEIKKVFKNKKNPDSKHVVKYLKSYYDRFSKIIEMICRVYPRGKGKKILDIGIAYGFYGIILKKRFGFNVAGGELKERIKKYCSLCNKYRIKVKPVDLLKNKLPFNKSEFDTIVLAEVIEHVPIAPYNIFKTVGPYIKKNGYLLITTPNIAQARNIMKLISGKNITEKFSQDKKISIRIDLRSHVREYDKYELISNLEKADFKIDSLEMLSGQGIRDPLEKILSNFDRYKKYIIIRAKKK